MRALLYTAKGTASLLGAGLGPRWLAGGRQLGPRVHRRGAAITIAAAVAAKFILAPARKRFIEGANEKQEGGIRAASPSQRSHEHGQRHLGDQQISKMSNTSKQHPSKLNQLLQD